MAKTSFTTHHSTKYSELQIMRSYSENDTYVLSLHEVRGRDNFTITFDSEEVKRIVNKMASRPISLNRYLVTGDGLPFMTNYFEPENHYKPGMTVIDTLSWLAFDGKDWNIIQRDNL